MPLYYEIVTYILTGLIGLCVGSFLNVLIYRIPNKMNIAKPASHCPSCNYTLKWYDNIPVLSYLILGGKCRNCKKHIPIRYTLVELANMLLWLLCLVFYLDDYGIYYSIVIMLVCSVLVCIFFIDLEHNLIFDRFQIAVLVLAIAVTVFDHINKGTSIGSHLLGAVLAGGFFIIMYVGAMFVLRKEGLGFGDVKLAAVTGLLLGWKKITFAMIFASVLASILLLIIRAVKHDEKGKEYPFAPFIVLGVIVSQFIGGYIFDWYAGLFF